MVATEELRGIAPLAAAERNAFFHYCVRLHLLSAGFEAYDSAKIAAYLIWQLDLILTLSQEQQWVEGWEASLLSTYGSKHCQ